MILCFHMPLFYFISGLTFSPAKYDGLKGALQAKSKGIGLQYACFEILGIILNFSLLALKSSYAADVSLLSAFIGIFFPDENIGHDVTMGFWLVYDIIINNWIALSVYWSRKSKRYTSLVLCVLYLTLLSLSNTNIIVRLAYGLMFFLAGTYFMQILSRHKLSLKPQPAITGGGKCVRLLIAVSILILLKYTSRWNTPVFMFMPEVGQPVVFIFNAFIGIVAFLILSVVIQKNSTLEWIGKNTLAIMFSHFALMRAWNMIMNSTFPSLEQTYGEHVWIFFPFWIFKAAGVLLMACLFAYVMNQWFPSLIGKGKLKTWVSEKLS